MNNFERVRDLVNEYVSQNGTNTEKTADEFIAWVQETYPNINKKNLQPPDITYNRYNNGLVDFPGPNVCLVFNTETDRYRMLGTGFKYTGPIYQYYGTVKQTIVGQWIDGVCKMRDVEITDLPEEIILRRDDLKEGVSFELKNIPVTVSAKERNVLVNFHEMLICGISVEDEGYWIFNASSEWADKTTYLCEGANDGTWKYYLETIDECIGETKRLVLFEAQKGESTSRPGSDNSGKHTSELSQILTAAAFEKSYRVFIEQADKNAVSRKAQGIKVPYGFSEKQVCDGADFGLHYGQGAPSAAPYFNWWVVSIYYMPDSGNIIMGIEEDRYPHLKEMTINPSRFAQVGNKKIRTAVFYETTKDNVNYAELHERFISVCEEVIRLGLK